MNNNNQYKANNPHPLNDLMLSKKAPTLKIRDLVDFIEPNTYLPKSEVDKFIKLVFFYIAIKMREGYKIDIPYFGKFFPRYRSSSRAYVPLKGKAVKTEPSIIPCFHAKEMLRCILNKDYYEKFKSKNPSKVEGIDKLAQEYAKMCIGDDFMKYLCPEENPIPKTCW